MAILLGSEDHKGHTITGAERSPQIKSFRPGETIRGALVLAVGGDRPHKLESLELGVRGDAATSWQATGDDACSETEKMFDVNIPLARQPIVSLTPGEHRFEFVFQIPDHLPPTVKTWAGRVKYVFKAEAVSARLFSCNGKVKEEFDVLPHLDLNKQEQLSRPRAVAEPAAQPYLREQFGQYTIHTERGGYARGETINVYIDAKEQLLQDLEKRKGVVQLIQEFVCWAGNASHKEKETVSECRPSDWRHFKMVVPRTSSISMDGKLCRVIRVDHYIEVKSPSLNVKLPVVIGTVPLRDDTRPAKK